MVARPVGAPWPSRLPEPTPAVLVDAPVDVCDSTGKPVEVTARGAFTGEPVSVAAERHNWSVQWWAGPWPCGLSGDKILARAQVLLDDERALLLHFGPGAAGGWKESMSEECPITPTSRVVHYSYPGVGKVRCWMVQAVTRSPVDPK